MAHSDGLALNITMFSQSCFRICISSMQGRFTHRCRKMIHSIELPSANIQHDYSAFHTWLSQDFKGFLAKYSR